MYRLVCALYEAGRPIWARQRGVDIKKMHTFLKCAPLALIGGVVCMPQNVCIHPINIRMHFMYEL